MFVLINCPSSSNEWKEDLAMRLQKDMPREEAGVGKNHLNIQVWGRGIGRLQSKPVDQSSV